MPACYTHIRTARNAAIHADLAIFNRKAFYLGTCGPDLFFYYRAWNRHPFPDLPALGRRLKKEQCGAFILSLLRHAQSAAQKGYVLGFLCHYATDTVTHPYVHFLTQSRQLYAHTPCGHKKYETALDSFLYEKDTGKRAVPAKACTGFVTGAALAEIAALLHTCLLEVYDTDIPVLALADSANDMAFLHKYFYSPFYLKKLLSYPLELLLFQKIGVISCHMTPARLKRKLPKSWVNPFTGEAQYGGMPPLLEQAEQRCQELMQTACKYWNGSIQPATAARHIGNACYETGLSLKKNRSAGKKAVKLSADTAAE